MTHTQVGTGGDRVEWMDLPPALDDHEIEALLAGRTPVPRDVAPMAELVGVLRAATAREPVPPIGPALRAQLDTSSAAQRAVRRSALWGATAAAVVAGVALVGVGAADNRLPVAMQDVVASTAHLVGIEVPRSDERPSQHGPVRSNAPAEAGDPAGPGGSDGTPGYEGITPGGADPADPGVPGDQTPAVPAVPPARSEGGGRPADAPEPSEPGAGTTKKPERTTTTETTESASTAESTTTESPSSTAESTTTRSRGKPG